MRKKYKKNLDRANDRQAYHYDLRCRPVRFEIGERVLKSNKSLSNKVDKKARKFFPLYDGLYFIQLKVLNTIYETKDSQEKSLVECDVNDVQKYADKDNE